MIESTTGHDVHEMIISGDATGCSTSAGGGAGGGAGGEIILNDVLGMKNQTLVINTPAATASQSDCSLSNKQKITGSAGVVSTDKKYSPPDYASKEKVCAQICGGVESHILLFRFSIVSRYIWISSRCIDTRSCSRQPS